MTWDAVVKDRSGNVIWTGHVEGESDVQAKSNAATQAGREVGAVLTRTIGSVEVTSEESEEAGGTLSAASRMRFVK